jgi:transcriptional regulator with XRE-family HTH domain
VKKREKIEILTEETLLQIGDRVRSLRKEKGWSQEDLANKTDIDLSYIGYIENGKHNITIKKLLQLSIAFNVSITDLIN